MSPSVGECHSQSHPGALGQGQKCCTKRTDPCVCSALGTTCCPGSSRPSTWMPWMQSTECPQPAEQQGQPWGPAKAWDHPCSFLSPLSSCSDIGNALLSQLHGACARPREPWTERTLLSGAVRPRSFMENASFHTPKHTNPKDQPGCMVGASRVGLCSLV